MSFTHHKNFLRMVLYADAVTCVVSGLALSLGAGALAGLTQLPAELLRSAGFSLFPIAAFILLVATRRQPPSNGVWLVILGNLGWVLGSVAVMVSDAFSPSGFGYAFFTAQALAVAALAELEYLGLKRALATRSGVA